ncbi:hypothetical protein [Streptomyces gibsoniae]|uniref:hypothetical protein n=1 Tax=Streptomyces gibsoniae TaxID=3075529 RepID=UPI00374E0F63
MNARRLVLIVSCAAVAGLGVLLAVLRWSRADHVASVVSCLAAVAAVGVGIWAALPARPARTGADPAGATDPAGAPDPERRLVIRVSDTGSATAGPGGRANSGVVAPKRDGSPSGEITAERTGDAHASRDSDANSGIRWD